MDLMKDFGNIAKVKKHTRQHTKKQKMNLRNTLESVGIPTTIALEIAEIKE